MDSTKMLKSHQRRSHRDSVSQLTIDGPKQLLPILSTLFHLMVATSVVTGDNCSNKNDSEISHIETMNRNDSNSGAPSLSDNHVITEGITTDKHQRTVKILLIYVCLVTSLHLNIVLKWWLTWKSMMLICASLDVLVQC